MCGKSSEYRRSMLASPSAGKRQRSSPSGAVEIASWLSIHARSNSAASSAGRTMVSTWLVMALDPFRERAERIRPAEHPVQVSEIAQHLVPVGNTPAARQRGEANRAVTPVVVVVEVADN